MHAVAVGADGGLGGTVGHGAPVHALLIGQKLLRTLAGARHHELLSVACAAGGGNVVVMNGRLGIVGGKNLVRAAVARQASRRLLSPSLRAMA